MIHNLLKITETDDFNKMLIECTNLKETDAYIKNMDTQAHIYESDNLNPDDVQNLSALNKQKTRILTVLQSKVLDIMMKYNLSQKTIVNLASKLKTYIDEDIDLADIATEQRQKIVKAYIIVGVILDSAKYLKLQQKTL